jgi:YqaJ-like viral recombinase domain
MGVFEPQGKDAWHLERYTKFTASNAIKLSAPGKNEMFTEGGHTYIEENAIECETEFWENPKLENVDSLLWGKRYEEPAFDHYCRITRVRSMRYLGTEDPLFLTYNEFSGGSPDGIMGEGEKITCGLELKCPSSKKIHWYDLDLKDQWDLKLRHPNYYSQIQFLLMITKAEFFHFASFDERFKDFNKRMVIVEVKPDQKFFDNFDLRLDKALSIRNEIIEKKNNRK